MSDLISRQEAIAHIKNRLYEMSFNIDAEHPYRNMDKRIAFRTAGAEARKVGY